MPTISIQNDFLADQAEALSKTLGFPLQSGTATDFTLGWLPDPKEKNAPLRLTLTSIPKTEVWIDFIGGKKNHRRQFGGGKGQPLARAVSVQDNPIILDATAGMGGDAFVFASLGCKVKMVERSPIVAALLEDALNRAQSDAAPQDIQEIAKRMQLINADAADYLLDKRPQVDVIYLDPMYPEKKKNAAAKKEMQALQQLVGPDMDSEKLLAAAIKTACKRVVVKRPKGASTLAGIQPNAQIKSPNTRYDIYVIKALNSSNKLSKQRL